MKGRSGRAFYLRSIVTKNILLFLVILLVAVAPLTLRYYRDSRDYEIQALASKLEFFAERGASWIDTGALRGLLRPGDSYSAAYRTLLETLQRIEREFGVDNAVVMRREGDGTYSYIAAGHDGFAIGEWVHIHALFPATYRATEDTWQAAEMMHSQLFGGRVGDTEYDQFLQINTPLKHEGDVVAILMLNKLRLADERRRPCGEVRVVAEAHLRDVRSRMADLRRMERALAMTIARCAEGRRGACPLIEMLHRNGSAAGGAEPGDGAREAGARRDDRSRAR